MEQRFKRFIGRVVTVTGASSGIGRAAALAFAQEGAKVVVADVDEVGGPASVRAIAEAGGDAMFVRVDVSQANDNRALVEQTVGRYGRLDVAVLNAGILHPFAPLGEVSEADFDRTIAVNLKGVFLGLRQSIARFVAQGGGGSIVLTASIAGLVGYPSLAAYAASKHGIIGLARTAALDYATQAIRVNVVAPGGVKTPMVEVLDAQVQAQAAQAHPLGRMAEPEEIAQAILYLASDAAAFVTGEVLTIDGGYTAR